MSTDAPKNNALASVRPSQARFASSGVCFRAFGVDNRVVAAVTRACPPDDLRPNAYRRTSGVGYQLRTSAL